ncbi:metallophosphoesterase [Streptomyces marincola]|uniref:metallophosphoesterase n=1 Tax=Streptomyces marincola TaxID=2878388 RepID=UPI001CF39D2A|nr:metallophosphoesterase [Streptomyces marincola]UCM89974.1 metallophosphoesterase [Streptomyces marincola]
MAIAAVITMLLLVAVVHWYLYRRLVRDVSKPGGAYRRIGACVLVLMPVLAVLAVSGGEFGVPFGVQQVIGWPGFYWYAALLYLTLTLLVSEIVRFVLLRRFRRAADRSAARVPGPAPAPAPEREPERAPEPAGAGGVPVAGARAADAGPAAGAGRPAGAGAGTGAGAEGAGEPERALPERRLVLSRGIAVGAGVVTAGLLGYGTRAARDLTTKHVTVPLAKLPRAGHGYRIAVVSDIHLGPIAGRSHCRRVVDAVNATQPDLIAVVGDLVDAEVDDLRTAAAPLRELRARDGAYYVTGNHEYRVGPHAWVEHVAELGLRPLVNARDELAHFDLAGVNDADGEGTEFGGPDYAAALGDRDARRATVLMAHQPVQIHRAVDHGVDLQLSGHTHGGQMWPATYIAGLANPTLAGLERYGDTQLYVTRGAGAWGPPVRIGADPDITVVRLASGQA